MDTKIYNYVDIEKKWQKKWFEKRIFETKKEVNKKFFIHFAYPGVSGYLHVGHMRGFTYCDIISRFKKMNGYDVLFPAGFHASGIPSIGFAKKVERKDPITIKSLKENGLTDKEIENLKDPYEKIWFFNRLFKTNEHNKQRIQ
jgi:leucyl-tRNA synthetase